MTTVNGTHEPLQTEIKALHQRIADLEAALEAVRQNEARLHMIMTNITDWVWEVDTNVCYTYVSPNVAEILGYEPDELLGKTPFDLMPPEEAHRINMIFAPIAAARQPVHLLENIHLHKSGAHRVVETSGLPFYDATGTFCGYRGVDRDITQRKQIEVERDQFFNLSPDMLGIAGFDGYFKRLNPAWTQVLGWSREELYAEPFIHFVHPEDQPATLAIAQTLSEERPIIAFVNRYRCKDGSYRWIEWVAASVVAQQRSYAVARDITSRVEQERELRLFKTLVESAPDGIAVADTHATILYANPAYQQMTGYNETLVGMNAFDCIANEEHTQIQELLQVLREQRVAQARATYRRADGSTFPVDASVFLMQDEIGQTRSISFIRDITERKQQEEELRTFKTLVEHAPDAISVANLKGIQIYVNPAFGERTGYGQQAIGMHVSDFYGVAAEFAQSAIDHIVQHGFWHGETAYLRPDGQSIPLLTSIFLIRDDDGNPRFTAAIERDLRQQRQAEAERTLLQQQIIDAQNAAIRELSTPLIPIDDHVVIMPLIGSVDTKRALQIMDTLLEGIVQHRATIAILDITGVMVVDTQVATALIRAAQAVKLMGAQVVLTGIRPDVAQTLVHLGADLSGIVTRSTLQAGIAYALRTHRNSRQGGIR